MKMSNQDVLSKRYDFVYLFDVKDGNPNGDPDAGNMPRIDPETGHGLVTDVCLKRKVRNYIEIVALDKGSNERLQIFIREGAVLNPLIEEAYDAVNKAGDKKSDSKSNARTEMCRRYYDVRTFGAVMTTGNKNAGQVRGPIQLTFSRSLDPIVSGEHTITRMAVTNPNEGVNQTMGRKSTVPYGLYKCHGFVSAHLAADTGFTEGDLELFWEALKNMFDHDHSAARGLMAPRTLIVFEHSTALGNAPAHKLLETVKIERKAGVTVPRSFEDYTISIDKSAIPDSIRVIELI